MKTTVVTASNTVNGLDCAAVIVPGEVIKSKKRLANLRAQARADLASIIKAEFQRRGIKPTRRATVIVKTEDVSKHRP